MHAELQVNWCGCPCSVARHAMQQKGFQGTGNAPDWMNEMSTAPRGLMCQWNGVELRAQLSPQAEAAKLEYSTDEPANPACGWDLSAATRINSRPLPFHSQTAPCVPLIILPSHPDNASYPRQCKYQFGAWCRMLRQKDISPSQDQDEARWNETDWHGIRC